MPLPELNRPTTTGKRNVVKPLKNQWENEPIDAPRALILLGNISDSNTQITAPCDEAKKAMKKMSDMSNNQELNEPDKYA